MLYFLLLLKQMTQIWKQQKRLTQQRRPPFNKQNYSGRSAT